MAEKSIENRNKSDFHEAIPEYSDKELIGILKKRDQYQKEAADLAIQEAIKRGLIHSEQDLFSEEYKSKPVTPSLFPEIEKEEIKNKIRKSIARGLLLAGMIPLVWGVIEMSRRSLIEGVLLVIPGLVWSYGAVKIMREYNDKMISVLFSMLILSLAYIVKVLLQLKGLKTMDFAIPIVLLLLISYGLIYLKRMHKQ